MKDINNYSTDELIKIKKEIESKLKKKRKTYSNR